jgi:hypothetical protein
MWVVGGLLIARSVIGVVAAFDQPEAGASSDVTSNPTPASTSAVTRPSGS